MRHSKFLYVQEGMGGLVDQYWVHKQKVVGSNPVIRSTCCILE